MNECFELSWLFGRSQMWHQCDICNHYLGGGRLTFLDARHELDLKGFPSMLLPSAERCWWVILWEAGAGREGEEGGQCDRLCWMFGE